MRGGDPKAGSLDELVPPLGGGLDSAPGAAGKQPAPARATPFGAMPAQPARPATRGILEDAEAAQPTPRLPSDLRSPSRRPGRARWLRRCGRLNCRSASTRPRRAPGRPRRNTRRGRRIPRRFRNASRGRRASCATRSTTAVRRSRRRSTLPTRACSRSESATSRRVSESGVFLVARAALLRRDSFRPPFCRTPIRPAGCGDRPRRRTGLPRPWNVCSRAASRAPR